MTTQLATPLQKESLAECNGVIIKAKEDIGKNLFILGAALKVVRDQELYKESCETFLEYIAQPEISLARATVYKAVKCYEVFACMPEVQGVDHDKLYLITGIRKNVSDAEFAEWVEKAKALSRSDLRDAIREAKGKPPKHSLSLKEKIAQFLDDDYPTERKERKKFIAEIVETWELWRND